MLYIENAFTLNSVPKSSSFIILRSIEINSRNIADIDMGAKRTELQRVVKMIQPYRYFSDIVMFVDAFPHSKSCFFQIQNRKQVTTEFNVNGKCESCLF